MMQQLLWVNSISGHVEAVHFLLLALTSSSTNYLCLCNRLNKYRYQKLTITSSRKMHVSKCVLTSESIEVLFLKSVQQVYQEHSKCQGNVSKGICVKLWAPCVEDQWARESVAPYERKVGAGGDGTWLSIPAILPHCRCCEMTVICPTYHSLGKAA